MTDYRRQIGAFAVFGLVLLRLAIGWHFYREGSGKVSVDPKAKRFEVTFSAESFLSQAKGPLASWFHSFAASSHDWATLLAVARQDVPPTADEASKNAKWQAEYDRRRADATRDKLPTPIEFPPSAPYSTWAAQIVDDWKASLVKALAIAGLTNAQKHEAEQILRIRQQQLADYLASESDGIAEYQHELWRLNNLRALPEATEVPFVEQRISGKQVEIGGKPRAWVSQVEKFEHDYFNELRGVFSAEQLAQATTAAAIDEAIFTQQQHRLRIINLVVTALTVGVGICLLLGFFTRLASLAGALFLFAVIATQPPWVSDAAPTYNQMVELAGLLVLAGTGAGRWAGLDYFSNALFSRWRRA